jgi:hypothetical protein
VRLTGARRRLVREHDERMELAWTTARLNAYAPEKARQFVKLDSLLHRETRQQQRQGWQAQAAILNTW